AYWARLLREAVTANTDETGTLSMVPGLKTWLNKALEKGDKQAVARSLMIWRLQHDLFTGDMEGAVYSQIIAALAQKTVEEIEAFAAAWEKHQDNFVTEDTHGYWRSEIIKALAPLTEEKIAVL